MQMGLTVMPFSESRSSERRPGFEGKIINSALDILRLRMYFFFEDISIRDCSIECHFKIPN